MARGDKAQQSDLKQLRVVLNQTGTSLKNNPLYQFLNELLDRLTRNFTIITEKVDEIDQRLTKLEKVVAGGIGTDINYYDTPLTDGNLEETDLIFANGECIIVRVPV